MNLPKELEQKAEETIFRKAMSSYPPFAVPTPDGSFLMDYNENARLIFKSGASHGARFMASELMPLIQELRTALNLIAENDAAYGKPFAIAREALSKIDQALGKDDL